MWLKLTKLLLLTFLKSLIFFTEFVFKLCVFHYLQNVKIGGKSFKISPFLHNFSQCFEFKSRFDLSVKFSESTCSGVSKISNQKFVHELLA
jgi:membrane-anchored glycerophosphoryl diester phosphodiesterase (GDPDase)